MGTYTTATRLTAYRPCRILIIYLQMAHRLDDGHDGLDGVAVHHHFVLLTLLYCVAVLMNDSATETKSNRLLAFPQK